MGGQEEGLVGVSCGCFGQQRRGGCCMGGQKEGLVGVLGNKGFGHGAGLGADRQQQQQVTGGNYPKAKHVPPPTKMYIFIQKQCLLFRQVFPVAGIFVAAY